MLIRSLAVTLAAASLLSGTASAQTGRVVDGRVVERGGRAAIARAQVELDGYPLVLTGPAGEFRYEQVEPGGYALRVTALGYAPRDLFLVVRQDTSLTIELERAPVRLDTLYVEGRTVDLRGRVTERGTDLGLFRVEVRVANGNRETETNTAGRFRLRAVPAGPPLALALRAFGYLPLDAEVVAEADTTLAFALEPDPLVQRMIAVEVRRLEERSRPYRAALLPAIDRTGLLRRAGGTVYDVVRSHYGLFPGRLKCIVIDDEQNYNGLEALNLLLPAELERIEFFERGAMLRIYTRDFIRNRLGSRAELPRPLYVALSNPPVCR
jgi:hypothetical protein